MKAKLTEAQRMLQLNECLNEIDWDRDYERSRAKLQKNEKRYQNSVKRDNARDNREYEDYLNTVRQNAINNREDIDEIALDEKTPNQKKSGRRSYDVQVSTGVGRMTLPVRDNTVYDDDKGKSHIMGDDGYMKKFKPTSTYKKSKVGRDKK